MEYGYLLRGTLFTYCTYRYVFSLCYGYYICTYFWLLWDRFGTVLVRYDVLFVCFGFILVRLDWFVSGAFKWAQRRGEQGPPQVIQSLRAFRRAVSSVLRVVWLYFVFPGWCLLVTCSTLRFGSRKLPKQTQTLTQVVQTCLKMSSKMSSKWVLGSLLAPKWPKSVPGPSPVRTPSHI